MAGYFEKNSLCKICCSFDDETLTKITLDLLLKRKSYAEIRKEYSPLLPPGVKPLNDVNLSNHRRHSDGEHQALTELAKKGEPVSEEDALLKIFREKYQTTKNSKEVIQEIFRQRLSNAQALQSLLDVTVSTFRTEKNILSILEKQIVQKHIEELTSDIDTIYDSLQSTFFKDEKLQKGIGDNTFTLNQIVVNDFQGSIKDMMSDVIDYILREFKDDPTRGKLLVTNIARIADVRVAPVINRLSSQVEDAEYSENE